MNNEFEKDDFDDAWENRILCSDGNCIGVIGPDGRCKECGKPHDGSTTNDVNDEASESPLDVVDPAEDEKTDEGQDAEPTDDPESDDDTGDDTGDDDDWENRTLCSDGNCIGIIGPDGKCKECGKPYEK